MRRLGLTRLVMIAGGIVLALAVVVFVTNLVAITHLRDSSVSVRAADQRIALANEFERRIIDIETGQRGYAITGHPRFLQPRNEALKMLPQLRAQLLDLERRTGDHAQVALLKRTFSHLESYIHGYSDRVVQAARRSLGTARKLVLTGQGKRRTDQMRHLLASFIRREDAEAQAQRARADASASHAVLLAVVGLFGIPLLILTLIALASRSVAEPLRRVAAAAARLRAGDLAVRVQESGAGEVRSLARAFNTMATGLQHSRDELESQNAELEVQQAELRRIVEELGHERDRIQGFHEFVARVAAEQEMDSLGEVLLEELAAIAGAEAGTLYAIEPTGPDESDRLRLIAARGFDRGLLAEAIERGHGLAGRAVQEGHPVEGSYGEAGLELPAFGQSVRVRHELHLPIGRPGGIVGVVSLARLGEPAFTELQKERLLQMSGPAAVALTNALSLEASERAAALNRAVLETAREAYIRTDEDGVILSWNRQAEELFGYSAGEALGKVSAELVFPDASDRRASAERRAWLKEGASSYTVWATRSDGHRIQVEVSATATPSGDGRLINYFARDVTDRHCREQEHAAAEAVSRILAEADADEDLIEPIIAALGESMDWPVGGYWELDRDAGVVRCSRVWVAGDFEFPDLAEFAGEISYQPGEVVHDFPILKEAWDAESVRWDVQSRPDELTDRQVSARSAGLRAAVALPVMSGQQMLGLLTFGSPSVTPPDEQRLRALRSITDLAGQVIERRRAEQEAERLKNEFFALVSHELRTPLTSIVGYLDIVREEEAGEVSAEQRHYLEVINRNARRLMRLVGDLLFVAQIEAGRLSLKDGEVDLEAVAREAVEAARPRAEKQGVLLAAETEPITLHRADSDRLGQLVDNLASNAIKFTPEGGSVTVRLSRAGADAVIEVSDTGMGISERDLANLFDRFYRTDDATKQAIPGIGLGLSISKAIAEGHGGRIAVQSEEGRGTTFTVELPLGGRPSMEGAPVAASSNGDSGNGAWPLGAQQLQKGGTR